MMIKKLDNFQIFNATKEQEKYSIVLTMIDKINEIIDHLNSNQIEIPKDSGTGIVNLYESKADIESKY